MIESGLYAYLQESTLDILILSDDTQAQKAKEISQLLHYEAFVLNDFRAKRGDDLRSYREEIQNNLAILRQYYQCKEQKILLTPFSAVLYPLPKPSLLQEIFLEVGQEINLKSFCSQLLAYGYEFVEIIESAGEVSVRGDIIDIYPPAHSFAYRLSFFDQELESIRSFDLQTQLCSKEEIPHLYIPAAFLSLTHEEYEYLQLEIQQSEFESLSHDLASLGFWHLKNEWTEYIFQGKKILLSTEAQQEIQTEITLLPPHLKQEKEILQMLSTKPFIVQKEGFTDFKIPAGIGALESFLQIHANKKIHIIARNETIFRHYKLLNSPYNLIYAPLHINFLTPTEVFISLNTTPQKRKIRKSSLILDEMKVGDYVVHKDYGIALFSGISQEKVLGALRDFIVLSYEGEDRLLLPVENLNYIDRYIAEKGSLPAIDRLGSGSFLAMKEKVKKRLLEIAEEIVALAAKRELIAGEKFNTSLEEIFLFQADSGFEYTPDQQETIADIFTDISSGRVMDRLLSGDVGFGKTEIAMNAIFVSVMSGFQAAILAPTTLLVLQHFHTLQERFSKYNIKVVRLDRFLSTKEKNSVLKLLESGEAHIVIGTHALLGVKFKKLGLIVIDEEHKFGVKQKEKIKQLSQNLHTLSMSATPIPRTLNQALSNIKSLSTLTTPPKKRQGVRTFVREYNENLIKECIQRELRRGGQIFYIHNNIATIQDIAQDLNDLIKGIKIGILHSKVDAKQSEDIMLEFAEGKIHILLSTSIVESGIHLPNANTIIVDGSDHFGIADLHQLRGRVGRGNVEGFCYFLISNKDHLTLEAKKRLLALESHSSLGSGSILAYQDLEIRGGGNLLGEAQSGHIKNIGYALYLRMLEEAIYSFTSEKSIEERGVDLKLSVSGFLSAELISSDRLRLDLYRRLSLCEELSDILAIELEISDRFGQPDRYTKQFLELITIKVLAKKLQIKMIVNYQQKITIFYLDDSKHQIEANSRDEDDLLQAILEYLRKKINL
ncbi:transcription-repair coupling factor [Helicobacter monodelphidis]|uniref:transcription-repair coupling factor n=1 Tax=Helicobacter sp. 15-1451 TaxID=2004995 RepID=UPI000DCD7D09|nr:transcription-repair coupling factor [Helicobacter sp. 15-1451]RAX57911.1 transcription-repair coupling factor [Helicobacter sp. 15-1451]